MRFLLNVSVIAMLALVPAVGVAKIEKKTDSSEKVEKIETPKEYTQWLDALKKEMVAKGISKKTIKKVYKEDYYRPDPEVVKIDRKQAEFVMLSTDYLNRLVNEKRVAKARQKYTELYPLFKDMEKKYGVQFNYLVAFWGVETNFGETFGNYRLIEVLTILSYDKRRSDFFKEELYQALKIIDKYDIDHEDMEGSWAGAMGHFQFMPSTFNNYAVDYDGDNKIDIWHSFEDAVASAANYLSSIGWDKNNPWGSEVSFNWDFDFANTGRDTIKPIKEWKKLGVLKANGKALDFADDLPAAIIIPEGKNGRAYLVLNNFKKIMTWNRSENYALAVSLLADYIASDAKYTPLSYAPRSKLKVEDVSKIQAFINKFGWGKLDEDGQLGSKTREAIKKVQKDAKMPQDGYPDYQLLQKINKYNPNAGFVVPVQPIKAKKK